MDRTAPHDGTGMTPGGFRFEIRAASSAQTLPRLLDHFALRGLTPSRVRARAIGADAFVVIEQPALDPHQASLIAEKMRGSVLADEVILHAVP